MTDIPVVASGPHGILGLSSPWARGAFRDLDERAEIEASIPPGYVIGVAGHAHGRSKVFVLWALGPGVDANGRAPELMRWEGRHDPVNAARGMAERLRAMSDPDPSWTEDAAGYVVAPLDYTERVP